MATLEQLEQALINADRAGRTEDARILAQELQRIMEGTREGPSYEESLEDFYRAFDKVRGDAGFFENITSGFGAGLVGTGEMAALGAASLLEEESELAAREKIKSVADSLRP